LPTWEPAHPKFDTSQLEHLLKRFDVARIAVVADRGLLSVDNIAQIRALALERRRQVDFILALSGIRYKAMQALMAGLSYTDGFAETQFKNERCVVAYDADTAARQSAKRRADIKATEALGQKQSDQLNAQDAAQDATEAALAVAAAAQASKKKPRKAINERTPEKRSQKANDRSAHARFAKELKDRKLTKYFTIDWEAERFTFEQNEAANAASEALDDKLVLLTSINQQTVRHKQCCHVRLWPILRATFAP